MSEEPLEFQERFDDLQAAIGDLQVKAKEHNNFVTPTQITWPRAVAAIALVMLAALAGFSVSVATSTEERVSNATSGDSCTTTLLVLDPEVRLDLVQEHPDALADICPAIGATLDRIETIQPIIDDILEAQATAQAEVQAEVSADPAD